jgi:hypothetical protein
MKGAAPAGLLAAALALGACDKTATFAYFNIDVVLDRATIDDELLDLIQTCSATATTPTREEMADMRCMRHRIGNDVGVFQYTTSLTSGSVTFSVTLYNYFGPAVAEGQLGPLGIAPGGTVDMQLVVHGIPGAPRVPSGTITPVGQDGATPDTAAPDGGVDAASDAADAAAVEAGADGAGDAAGDAGPDVAPDA